MKRAKDLLMMGVLGLSFLAASIEAKETAAMAPFELEKDVPEQAAEILEESWCSVLEAWPEIAVMEPSITQRVLSLKRVTLPDPCNDLICLTRMGHALDVQWVLVTHLEKGKRRRLMMTVKLLNVENAEWATSRELDLDVSSIQDGNTEPFTDLAKELFPPQQSQATGNKPQILEDKESILRRQAATPQGMVYIPASTFLMGSEKGERDERDPHLVQLPGYYIGIHEVTNEEYKAFVEGTNRRPPAAWKDERLALPGQPVVGISWEDAHAYAQWRGFRLPSEAEWERAARGTDGRTYPWGEAPPLEGSEFRCNLWGGEDGFEMTSPVGSFPSGASPEGCMDMAGNVWEWVNSLYRPYPFDPTDGRENRHEKGDRCVRGGCWVHSMVVLFRCSARNSLSPKTEGIKHPYLGFRCAASVKE